MARQKSNKAGISGTISPGLKGVLEEYRWSNRMTFSAVLEEAIVYWAIGNGLIGQEDGILETSGQDEDDDI